MTILAKIAGENRYLETGNWASIYSPRPAFRHYGVYGVSLRSQIALALPQYPSAGHFDIELLEASSAFFSAAVHGLHLESSGLSPFEYALLQDGASYVRWEGLGEFLVASDGRRIACRRFPEAQQEAFEVYLLGRALSFALVKNGREPLHATCVVIDGEGVVFLGDSGYGKSSLAACFLQAGHRLLTDDLLVLCESPGGPLAYPGPPRIKLFPAMARRFLGPAVHGNPMNSRTRKVVIPLDPDKICVTPAPLRAIYALVPPRPLSKQAGVRIAPLSSREAFVTLLNHAFNYVSVAYSSMGKALTMLFVLNGSPCFFFCCASGNMRVCSRPSCPRSGPSAFPRFRGVFCAQPRG